MEMLKRVFDSEVRGVDEKEGTITAYISTNTVDRYREVLDPEGMDATNFKKNPVVLWAHNYDLPPIGKALWTKRDGDGVISKVKFADTDFAQEIFSLYKGGFLKAFSVGFIPKETENAKDEDYNNPKKPRRTYKSWELLEYSAVPVPANPDAVSLAIQRGVLKTKSIQELLEHADTEKEFKSEDVKSITVIPLEDLMAENEQQKKTIESLTKENDKLRIKLFDLLTKTQQRLSEITGFNVLDKVDDIVARVVRKLQGDIK